MFSELAHKSTAVAASPTVVLAQPNLTCASYLSGALTQRGVRFAGSWPDTASAFDAARDKEAIVLADVVTADGRLIDLLEADDRPRPRIVVYAAKLPYSVLDKLAPHASGFVLHHEPLDELVSVLQRVAAGRRQDSVAASALIERPAGEYARPVVPPEVARLSKVQIEILMLLATGAAVKKVAQLTSRSPKSIDGHKYRIMRTLGLNDRVELAHFAIAVGLIEPRYDLLRANARTAASEETTIT